MSKTERKSEILYWELLKNPNLKLTSRTQAESSAVRKYAMHLRGMGSKARDIYKILRDRFGYSEPGAKVVIADTFFNLNVDERYLLTKLFRFGGLSWTSGISGEQEEPTPIALFMNENGIESISGAIESEEIEIYTKEKESSLQLYILCTLLYKNSGLTFATDEDFSLLNNPTYTQNWSPGEGWKKL